MDTTDYDSHCPEIEHEEDSYYDPYYADHCGDPYEDDYADYSYIDEQKRQIINNRLELKNLRKKLSKEKAKLKKEKQSLKQQKEEFEKEKEAQRLKWDEISKDLNAKIKNKQLEDEQVDDEQVDEEQDDDTKPKKIHEPDHEKCHNVNKKLKNKLKIKTKECQELQEQIEKLRKEVRQSHDYYDKFLEHERKVIKQKYDIQQITKENVRINKMYQDLLNEHEILTNKYKEIASYIEYEPSSSSSSSTPTPALKPAPRPIPKIIRNSPSSNAALTTKALAVTASAASSAPPPSFVPSSNIGTKFREVGVLNQQIPELHEQLLQSKETASGSRSVTPFGRETDSKYEKDEKDETISPLPPITNFDEDADSVLIASSSSSCFSGIITSDMEPVYGGTKTYDMDSITATSGNDKIVKKRKKYKLKGFLRLFRICSSSANNIDD